MQKIPRPLCPDGNLFYVESVMWPTQKQQASINVDEQRGQLWNMRIKTDITTCSLLLLFFRHPPPAPSAFFKA